MKNFLRYLEWMSDMLGLAGVMIGRQRYMLVLAEVMIGRQRYMLVLAGVMIGCKRFMLGRLCFRVDKCQLQNKSHP